MLTWPFSVRPAAIIRTHTIAALAQELIVVLAIGVGMSLANLAAVVPPAAVGKEHAPSPHAMYSAASAEAPHAP